ncbi:MAG: ABC transporter ATP-binding protein/permease [Lachnospiraceae bacterium]|nr:ABC transporter ATP-binding protein/permease [Lachnospiraceae bacterium]
MYKKLAKSIREYKRDTLLSPLFVTLEVIMECLIPFVISNLVNNIRDDAEMNLVLKDGVILVMMALLSLSFGIIAAVVCSRASTGFAKNLRKDMFYSIQNYSFENIDKFSTPSLVTRLTTDITNVQMAFMMLIRVAVRSPLMLIFAFFMAFKLGGKMAWIFVVVVPILGFGIFGIALKAMPIFRRIFKKYDALNSSVEENVKAIRVVKSFDREEYEKEKFNKASGEVKNDFTSVERLLAWNGPLMQFCLYSVMVFVISFGSYLIMSTHGRELDVGQYSALLTYSFMILSSLMMFSMVFVMLTMSREAVERIVQVIDEKPTLANPENPVMSVDNGSIDFEKVSFKYSAKAKKNALSDIELHIKSGETVGIIGGTGSSKSTLIQLIPRLYDATEGCVKVGGRDVKDYDIKTLRDAVSVVLQKNTLFSGTIIENLRWGNKEASIEEIKEACRLSCADEFIEQFPDKYETHIEQGGTNVSGGQKQRLCIARAILKKPRILIMDDSTSAVDTKTDAYIRAAMKESLPETTKIIIAQRTSSIENADKIIVLDNGIINAIGTHKELMESNAIYKEIYISQNKQEKD